MNSVLCGESQHWVLCFFRPTAFRIGGRRIEEAVKESDCDILLISSVLLPCAAGALQIQIQAMLYIMGLEEGDLVQVMKERHSDVTLYVVPFKRDMQLWTETIEPQAARFASVYSDLIQVRNNGETCLFRRNCRLI